MINFLSAMYAKVQVGGKYSGRELFMSLLIMLTTTAVELDCALL